ncbi:hypothetical protein Shal_1418 [Shewanella halifaxensis HAW-EB4]|uniref:Uncharacterized protein n=1 Tax=Shewanella halifaxensis (strain HAW-EB4) TaxID=458817 RepID=B0TMB5_SHEHH|nr:hypothetical protein [Shewanella halifaxensis]ABZ75984.1 hypothetical protein Shal_1418 [Shewanella halifaxensis HAW-EB4]
MNEKYITQAKLLFPASLYPLHSTFVDLLLQWITKQDIDVSAIDIEILSLAIGADAHELYKVIDAKENTLDKLKSIIFDGLQFKISAKKRLNQTGLELAASSNKPVVELVFSQYQAKLDAIEALKQQAYIEQQAELQREIQAKNQALQEQLKAQRLAYESCHVNYEDFEIQGIKKNSRVDKLLSQLRKKPISADELKWLDDVGFANEMIQRKYHIQLAHQHYQNWKQKHLPWELVNASAAYRKAEEVRKIKKALDALYPLKFANNDTKLKSALLTTYGGVCRDLQSFERGIDLGHEAHKVTPLNFRPCTLLGAIYLSTGEFTLGHDWYDKAKERGFSQAAYENDIKSVYFRASKAIKGRLKQNLIATGHKYKWL